MELEKHNHLKLLHFRVSLLHGRDVHVCRRYDGSDDLNLGLHFYVYKQSEYDLRGERYTLIQFRL